MKEQAARAKLASLVSEKPFIRGSISKRELTCGNPGCQCNEGKKHIAYYIGVRYQNKRQIIHVPSEWVPSIRKWIETYQEIAALTDDISSASIRKLVEGKRKIIREE
jgi:hypothetical protein